MGKVIFIQTVSEMKDLIIPFIFILLLLNTTCSVLANSVDPDQLATDLDLHCSH